MKSIVSSISNLQRSNNPTFDRGIGFKNKLLFPCKNDMKFFARTTRAGVSPAVIMGRLTWEMFEPRYRPLKGRTNIVISSDWLQIMAEYPGVYAFPTPEKAIAWALQWHQEIWIIGGGTVYAALLKYCEFLYLTEINNTEPCDAFFPAFEDSFSFAEEVERGFCDDSEVQYVINLYRRN